MIRRDFLKYTGALAQSFVASEILTNLFIENAHGQNISVQGLRAAIAPGAGTVLVPQDAQFAQYQKAFNMRTVKTPLVRVLCASPQAVTTAIQWGQSNSVPLAVRSGGHSFEGLSQGTGLVIDTRPMKEITLSANRGEVTVGAGVQINEIYQKLAPYGLTIAAGSGPTVGIAGHTLGGGYGMLARAYGLACDNLVSATVVDAQGAQLQCSEKENADLFWALRGGGAGSFGIVTKLTFKTHQVTNVLTFILSFNLQPKAAATLMKDWQQWAPSSPRAITSLMKVSRRKDGLVKMILIGQALGSDAGVRHELANLTNVPSGEIAITNRTFTDAVRLFSGGFDPEYLFMKGKSDYLKQTMSDAGLTAFMQQLPTGFDVIFDSYGAAINDLGETDTAFAHRGSTISSLQYYTQWASASAGQQQLANMRKFYQAMRPYMSGSAYFNYCDLDLPNYAEAYWGQNLPRLIEIKGKFDPNNFFAHAQSIPPA